MHVYCNVLLLTSKEQWYEPSTFFVLATPLRGSAIYWITQFRRIARVRGPTVRADDTQFHGSCAVYLKRRLVWLAVPCASSTRSKSGCRQTVFGWMLIRPSSFGWAQVTFSEIATCGRSIQSCRPPMLWTILETIYIDSELTLERQVCYFHLRRLRTVRRSLSKECLYARWFMPSSLVELITATASYTEIRILFISSRLHACFSPCWILPLAWFWT